MATTPKFPPTIYKYRCWDNELHQRMLTHGEVYMSSPKDFNDPFDCRVFTDFSPLSNPATFKQFVELKEKRYTMTAEQKSAFTKRLSNLNAYQQEADKVEVEMNDKHYGILSLSSRWDSILMWSHYANNHKGFCIGFNEAIMRNSELFGKGGSVSYGNYPKISPFADNPHKKAYITTHSKSKEWEYEQEYRLSKTYYPNEPTNRVICVPENAITEVYLGLEISQEHKNKISAICREKNIPLYQITKEPFAFKLTRVIVAQHQ